MARHGRYFLPDQPLHVTQRGNNRNAIFFGIERLRTLPNLVSRSSRLIRLSDPCLCADDQPRASPGHSRACREPAARHAIARPTLCARDQRRPTAERTLWEGRYRAAPIDSEAYFLACCRYIELNPGARVHGGAPGRLPMVELPGACARVPKMRW